MKNWTLGMILLCAVVHVASTGCGAAGETEMQIALYDAAFKGEQRPSHGATLLLDVRQRQDGTFHRIWGVARDFSIAMHPGRVLEAEITDDEINLSIAMDIRRDSWGWGSAGRGSYDISLTRGEDGKLTGTYTGTLRGIEVGGQAEGKVLPPRPMVRDGEPAQPGEHPRILMRRDELEHYRRRMDTPFGEAAMRHIGDGVVGLAFKYALTGDEELAERCIEGVEKLMAPGAISDQFGNNLGARMQQVAIAYDFCYDAWPESYKRKVEDYFVWATYKVFYSQNTLGGGINWNILSNWSAPIYTGVGFAGLAVWGEQGPPPKEPIEPNAGVHIEPDRDYTPGRDVPVIDFQSDEMPDDWIYVYGLRSGKTEGALAGIRSVGMRLDGYGDFTPDDDDPLADIGGMDDARPEVGTEVTYGEETHTFRPVSHEKDKGYWEMGGELHLDVTHAAERQMWCRNFFFTVIRNDRPRWVTVPTSLGAAAMYINGVRVGDGDTVYLADEGLYPVMLDVPLEWMNAWGRHFMRPRLVEVDEQRARRLVELRKSEYQEDLADWRFNYERWEQSGGQDQDLVQLFEAGRQMMYRYYRDAMGTRGWQGELTHYGNIAASAATKYAPAYRTMFCRDVSPYDDATHFLPAAMMSFIYPQDGEPWAQQTNTRPQLDADFFAPLFPIVPERYKPAVLWAWKRHVAGDATAEAERLAGHSPLYAFLNYPVDMDSQPPAEVMPLTWDAPDFGHYVFRDGWEGGDDFVAQVWLKAAPIHGWNSGNAGTFRLAGLGHRWAVGPTDRNRARFEENVVQLPENPEIIGNACGRATHVEMHEDGSGVVSIDLNDVYATSAEDGPRRYSSYGRMRYSEAFADSGITGMRSIGVDYSGASGAPCLMVIVDKIDGGGQKLWTWQLPAEDVARTTVDGNTFTVRKPDGATLRGTFVGSEDVRVFAEVRRETMTGKAGSQAGKELARPVPGVFATGADNFFAVITVQRGDPPEVGVSGEGLDTTVTVGGREVRFDGEKVVFTDAD
ncbi:MAG: hypothetical protein ACP5HU_01330 [Phycisphaerae bacterium]